MRESEIRRKDILERYQQVSLQDAQKMDASELIPAPCPGCGASRARSRFKNNGFLFVQCRGCSAVFGRRAVGDPFNNVTECSSARTIPGFDAQDTLRPGLEALAQERTTTAQSQTS